MRGLHLILEVGHAVVILIGPLSSNKFISVPDVTPEERVSRVLELVEVLPEQNKAILYYICAFLYKVSEHVENNQMTIFNLSVVFGMVS